MRGLGLAPGAGFAAGGWHLSLSHRRCLLLALATTLVLGGVASRASAAELYRAYVASNNSKTGLGQVTPIDVATNKAGKPIPATFDPHGIAITPNGKTAYVIGIGGVTPIEVATNKPGTQIAAVGYGIAITPNGQTAYATNFGSDTVTPIDVATNEPGTPINVGSQPWGVAITPNGKTAYVTNAASGTVTPIEVASNTAGTPITVGGYPQEIAITPNGKTTYVTNAGGTVTPIEVASNTAGTPITVGKQPEGVAITPNGKTAYVTNLGSGTVTPIEVASNTAGTPISVGGNPVGIAITPNGETAYVTNFASGSVTPIDLATNKAGNAIPVGSLPIGIAITSVAEAKPVNVELPKVSGSPVVGATLSCSEGTWTGSPPPSFTYQWLREGSSISGAKSSEYKVMPEDQGHDLLCEVTATNGRGSVAARSASVSIPAEAKPVNVELPKVSGSPVVGATLSCSEGKWTGSPPPSFTYQWLREGSAISGAKSSEYKVMPEDQGHDLLCEVTATNSRGSVAARSASVSVPAEAAEAPTVETQAVTEVEQTSVVLNATVNPNRREVTECEFEYGTTSSYGSMVPCATLPGSGNGAIAVAAAVGSLGAGDTYYFRVVAENAGGTSYGAAKSFMTLLPTKLTQQTPVSQGVRPVQENKAPAVPDAKLASVALTANSSGTVSVKVTCPIGESACTGTVTLKTLTAVGASATVHQARKRKAAILTLATGTFKVLGGKTTTVKLRLSAEARALLVRTHVLRARATIVAHDPAGATHTTQAIVTVRQAKTSPTG